MKVLPQDVPRSGRGPKYSIRIARPGSPSEGIIISEIVAYRTHFWNGRTRPCSNDGDCDPCRSGASWRMVGYCWMTDHEHSSLWIQQLPYGPLSVILDRIQKFGSIIGYGLKLERCGKSIRSQCRVGVSTDRMMSANALPELPIIEDVLRRIWSE